MHHAGSLTAFSLKEYNGGNSAEFTLALGVDAFREGHLPIDLLVPVHADRNIQAESVSHISIIEAVHSPVRRFGESSQCPGSPAVKGLPVLPAATGCSPRRSFGWFLQTRTDRAVQ